MRNTALLSVLFIVMALGLVLMLGLLPSVTLTYHPYLEKTSIDTSLKEAVFSKENNSTSFSRKLLLHINDDYDYGNGNGIGVGDGNNTGDGVGVGGGNGIGGGGGVGDGNGIGDGGGNGTGGSGGVGNGIGGGVGDGGTMHRIGTTCSKDNIVVFQGQTTPLPNGIPTYTVQIQNACASGCSISDIHLSCGWFSSARMINPRLFRRVCYDDCLVNNGEALSPGQSLSFQYANSFSYPLSVSSVACT